MAFTLQIRQKKLFGKTVLDIPSLAHACGFCYGSNNDFYILQENEQANGTAVFYHPEHIGRGIFFDGSRAREGYYEISYNIPTTRAEITAFYALTEECESIFPVRADGFLNLSELKVTEGFVQFVLYSEQRVLEGMFPYEQFIEELNRYDVRKFDADHIMIPPMTKADLENLAEKLR